MKYFCTVYDVIKKLGEKVCVYKKFYCTVYAVINKSLGKSIPIYEVFFTVYGVIKNLGRKVYVYIKYFCTVYGVINKMYLKSIRIYKMFLYCIRRYKTSTERMTEVRSQAAKAPQQDGT